MLSVSRAAISILLGQSYGGSRPEDRPADPYLDPSPNPLFGKRIVQPPLRPIIDERTGHVMYVRTPTINTCSSDENKGDQD
ncbi:hypothetical protein COU60_02670 [Candidatus Pacearchaeota archaeon CG10_big_fil_rev_8_21_14_0_10_34_76]|nr:MAG: hypothetical protein COU60_02670 [Candidatus Pacearchaeota archaeon CG10_big_fil_rev_8_21_14_0_10_34_76]